MKKKYQDYIKKDHSFDKATILGILCLVVVIAGLFGWLYEVIFYFFNSGMRQIYWRGGNFLPWINIYAIGAVLVVFVTYKLRKKPLLVFFLSATLCGILEYIAGWGVDRFGNGIKCWNYNYEILNFGNIHGYVCLRSVFIFGICSLMLIYLILPFCFYLAHKMEKKKFLTLSYTLCAIFLFDEFYNLLFARLLSWPRASAIYKKIGFHYLYFR